MARKNQKEELTTYALHSDDDRRIRIKTAKNRLIRSEILTLSHESVSFLAKPTFAFKKGDHLTIEFQVPKGRKLAWYGVVETISDYRDENRPDEKFLKLEVFFNNIPDAAVKMIDRGLQAAIKAHPDQLISPPPPTKSHSLSWHLPDWNFHLDQKSIKIIHTSFAIAALLFATIWGALYYQQNMSGQDWAVEAAKKKLLEKKPYKPFGRSVSSQEKHQPTSWGYHLRPEKAQEE